MSSLPVTYEMVRHSAEINTYIQQADASLIALGYTEHSFAHVTRCAAVASHLLEAARLEYLSHGVEQSAMDLCRSQEGAMRAAAYCGYRVDRLLVKFPGITV